MQALRTSIVTINTALMVSCLQCFVVTSLYVIEMMMMTLLYCDSRWRNGPKAGPTC
jgi:hypothetical protein